LSRTTDQRVVVVLGAKEAGVKDKVETKMRGTRAGFKNVDVGGAAKCAERKGKERRQRKKKRDERLISKQHACSLTTTRLKLRQSYPLHSSMSGSGEVQTRTSVTQSSSLNVNGFE